MTKLATGLISADPNLDIQVCRSFELARDAWLNLQEEAACFGFQSYSWLSTVWEVVGCARPGQLAIVLVTDMTRKPLMLIPLVERRHGGMRVLEFINEDLTDYNAPLVRREFIQELGNAGFPRVWKMILDCVGRVDAVRLEKMVPSIDGVQNPFLQLECQQEHLTFQASLNGGFDTYVKGRKAHFMRNLRRGRRNLAKLGTVELRTLSDPEEAVLLIDEMVRLKSVWCRSTGTKNMFESNPATVEFYREICRREVGGLICTGSLTVNDRIVAVHLGLVFRGRFYGLLQASDFENFSSYSPGGLLMIELIQWCCEQGISIFDFSIGSEAYKADLTDEIMPLYRHDRGLTARGKLMSVRTGGYARLKVIVKQNPRLLSSLKTMQAKLREMQARLASR